MNTRYWDKSMLYSYVDDLRRRLNLFEDMSVPDPFNIALHHVKNPCIECVPFPTTKICGILYKGDHSTSIALNANRTREMQNFDCMHELIHYFLHDIDYCQCICSDTANISQNSYLEWQANEGSAQFLVPYQDFIPRLLSLLDNNATYIRYILADHYHVTTQVISIRMDSLAYEIDQYRSGTPMDRLELLSRNQRKRRGITTTCYGALCDFPLDLDSAFAADKKAV